MSDTNPPQSLAPFLKTPRRRRWWLRVALYGGGTIIILVGGWFMLTQPFVSPGDKPSVTSVSPERLKAHVQMLSETLAPRDIEHPVNLDRAAEYITQELRTAGGRVSEQHYTADGMEYRNILAGFGPDTTERIVVGAHYDTCGLTPGADDNASGIAGLIELANLLGRQSPPLKVELAAYPLEEPPYFRTRFMGSAIHAVQLKRDKVNVRAMVVLEMIGYFSDTESSQHFPLPFLGLIYPRRGNFIAVVGKLNSVGLVRRVKAAMRGAADLPVYSFNAPTVVPGIDWSDHINFWREGYPAVMITDTAFLRNPNYHERGDTATTLDYHRMAKVVQEVYAAVLALGEHE